MTDERLKKGLLLRAAILFVGLLAVISAYLAGWLPARFLGPVLIAVIAPCTAIYWRFIRRYSAERHAEAQAPGVPLDESTRKKYRSSVRTLRITAAAFTAILIYASLATAGDSVPPRIVGTVFDVLIIFSCLITARRLQLKLRDSEAGTDHPE